MDIESLEYFGWSVQKRKQLKSVFFEFKCKCLDFV